MKKVLLLLVFALMLSVNSIAQCITAYPYFEDFETGPGSWVPGGTNSDWSWGTPGKTLISQAGSGINCWITGGLMASSYNGSEKSFLESPCFDFTSVQNPFISFKIFWETERQYDGGNLQYSVNGGITWINVGSYNDPVDCMNQNWYNNQSVIHLSGLVSNQAGWSGTIYPGSGSCQGGGGNGQWVTASKCMLSLAGEQDVKFRFTFGSGSTCNDFDGLAIDSIWIGEAPQPQVNFTYICNGLNTVEFTGISEGCPFSWTWDFGDGNTGNGVTSTHTYANAGLYTVTLNTQQSCNINSSYITDVFIPGGNVITSPVTCADSSNGKAVIQLDNPVNPQVTWNTVPVQYGDSAIDLAPGNYSVDVIQQNACPLHFEFEIIYGPDAFPETLLPDSLPLCPGENLVLYPGIFNDYFWNDSSVNSTFQVNETGLYSVTVINATGCQVTDSVLITEGCAGALYIPNSFTPNNDGLNDVFRPYGRNILLYNLQIFNRLGQLVYESSDPSAGWDGNYNGREVGQGAFVYVLWFRTDDLKARYREGMMYLIR